MSRWRWSLKFSNLQLLNAELGNEDGGWSTPQLVYTSWTDLYNMAARSNNRRKPLFRSSWPVVKTTKSPKGTQQFRLNTRVNFMLSCNFVFASEFATCKKWNLQNCKGKNVFMQVLMPFLKLHANLCIFGRDIFCKKPTFIAFLCLVLLFCGF